MAQLPSGTVTFLFSDIEGSTRLWEEHPDSMSLALARHDALVRAAIEQFDGYVFKTVGDGFCAAFQHAAEAVGAAFSAQSALTKETWLRDVLIKVRMAVHTGSVESRNDDYFGQPLNRVARILNVGHGGQVLVSDVTHDLSRDSLPSACSLKSLGDHRLKDLGRPETIFQLCHPGLRFDFPALLSLESMPTNLPQQITSFIGREKELADVKALLEKSRLVTLTGSGGSGKTRLALHAAADMLDGSGDGVWLVELAPLTDSSLVARTAAGVLGVKEEQGKPIQQTLTNHLRSKHMLVVLDNCEHLLDACAALADAILRSCPKVMILATSREGLGIAGETTYRVPSLSLPDPKQAQTPESLSHYESVNLFIERAQLQRASFTVTNQNAPALASVCFRLDGIPLAIELAAARLRSLSVEEINSKLDQRFRLLTGGSRAALPRQQTLRSLIDWSYDLLNEGERAVLCRLSVFSGGWTLESAEKVCDGDGVEEWEILDHLSSLTDKSLVVAETSASSVRFRLLETVREYAQDRLQETGGAGTWHERHLDYFLNLAEDAAPHLTGADQRARLDSLEDEHDNLRAALSGVGDRQMRLAAALWRFWMVRGHVTEGRRRFDLLLAGNGNWPASQALGDAFHGAAGLAYMQSDFKEARLRYARAAAIRGELGDRLGEAGSLCNLATIAQSQGDLEFARNQFEQSLPLFQEAGDLRGVAICLTCLGTVTHSQGDEISAYDYLNRAIALNREIGDRASEANALNNLGTIYREMRNFEASRAAFEQALQINRELDYGWEAALNLINISQCAIDKGNGETARDYLTESIAILRKLDARRDMASWMETWAGLEVLLGRRLRAARMFGAASANQDSLEMPHHKPSLPDTEISIAALKDPACDGELREAFVVGLGWTLERAADYALSDDDE